MLIFGKFRIDGTRERVAVFCYRASICLLATFVRHVRLKGSRRKVSQRLLGCQIVCFVKQIRPLFYEKFSIQDVSVIDCLTRLFTFFLDPVFF